MEEMQYDEMTLEDIFKALKKRWLLIVSVTLMFLIGGSVFVLFFGPVPQYQSSTTVLVDYRFNKEIHEKNFVSVIIKEKKNLWDALKIMLSKELKEGNDGV